MVNSVPWVVHKFGGSSVADAGCFRRVAAIVDSLPATRVGIVLSACRGVTDALLGLVALAERQDDRYRVELSALRSRHAEIAETLLTPESARLYLAGFDRDCHDVEGILHTVKLTRAAARNVSDLIVGYGEIWSTKLFHRFYAEHGSQRGPVQWIDARRVVVVEWGPLGPGVQWAKSRANLSDLVDSDFKGTLIITGFIASDPRGVQTTLGRNGSDFSGSIFGALLDAAEIHIWTDVDGVLSADPRRVPDATVIDSLTYNEAMELAYFGAKVIHPQTMAPAVGGSIPIWIRNTFAPEKPGTLICAQPTSKLPVKGIASIEQGDAHQPRGCRHDRCARDRAPALRRAARGGHLGHPHLPGQLRALDLLRHPARTGRARGGSRSAGVRAGAEGGPDPERRDRPEPRDPRHRRRRHGGNAGRCG